MLFRDSFERNAFGLGLAYGVLSAAVMVYLTGSVFTSPDSILHTYIAAAIFNNGVHSKIANLGTVWLPFFHLLIAPLTMFKPLYSLGLAGTLVNAPLTGGILVYLSRIVREVTPRRDIRYGAICLFLASGMTMLYSATPMTEQLSIFLALAGTYYFHRYWRDDSMSQFVIASVFIVLATLTRYEFWFVAAAFVVAMAYNELRNGRRYNLAFLHLPLWGGFLWVLWNAGLFGHPLYFIASRSMPVSVTFNTVLASRVMFLVVLLLVGGVTFLLPLFLEKEHYTLGIVPAVVFGLYVVAYLLGFHGLLTNLRYGYVLFAVLVPSVVVLRRFDSRATVLILSLLIVSTIVSSGLLLGGVYANVLGVDRVQERYAHQTERPDGEVLLPIRMTYDTAVLVDMDDYPNQYVDSYDDETWIEASQAPWDSQVEYVIIPPVSETRLEAYRDSGPNDGIVWNYHTDDAWKQRFDRHFTLVDPDIGMYKRTSGAANTTQQSNDV